MNELAVKYNKDIEETEQNFKEQSAFICSICLLEIGCKVGWVILFGRFLMVILFTLTKQCKKKINELLSKKSKLLMLVGPFFSFASRLQLLEVYLIKTVKLALE